MGLMAAMLEVMPSKLASARRSEGLSLRECALQIGISFNTIYRIENGKDCNLSVAVKVLRWIDGVEQEERATNHTLSDIRHSHRRAS